MRYYSSLFLKTAFVLSGVALTTTSFMSGPQQEASQSNGNRTEDIRRLPGKETVADFRGVAKKAIPAVVSIKVQSQKRPSMGGTGDQLEDPFDFFGGNDLWNFFGIPRRDTRVQPLEGQASGVIVSPKGYILTNSHVVHGMDKITVQLHDGREFQAKVLGDDPNSELALIQIDAGNLPYLSLGNSDALEVGQWVAAIGNPFGLQATLTVGVVSAKSRNNLDIARYEDFIQTDAAINRGNSGGPLVTLDGEVIGINTAIATTAASGYLGIGFAIPSNMAKNFMDEILSNGKITRGFLGVSLQSIDYNLAKAFGLQKIEGALITNVSKNSAAEKAGLQAEDIILRINDRPIDSAAALRNEVYMLRPGTQVTLSVWRKDQLIQIPVTIGEYSEGAIASSTTGSISAKNSLGIEVSNITPEIAQQRGNLQEQGVVVTKVNPSSIAALAGLKKGALILAVNRQKIANVEEFNNALAKAPKDQPVLLQIKQGDIYLFLSLQQSINLNE
jgi:serine protease Do